MRFFKNTDPIPLPDNWRPASTILKGITLGQCADRPGSSKPLVVPGYQHNTVIWGPVGSGTTNMLRAYLANLVAMEDTVLWLVDPERTHTDEFLSSMLDGTADQPRFDWVAASWGEAVTMTEMAAQLAAWREKEWADSIEVPTELMSYAAPKQIILMVVSGDSDMGFAGREPTTQAGYDVRKNLIAVARAGDVTTGRPTPTNVNVVMRLHRLTWLGELRTYINSYIGLAGVQPEDLALAHNGRDRAGTRITGEEFTGEKFTAVSIAGPTRTTFRPYFVPHERVIDLTRTHSTYMPTLGDTAGDLLNNDADANQIGGWYLNRWHRTFPALFGDEPVPAKYVQLGRPTLPDNLAHATERQLNYALFNSPSVVSADQEAAATILAHGCGQKLITSQPVREAMYVEDGQLYIRWNALTAAAAAFEGRSHSTQAAWHPDAGILLRLAAQLATGGITDSTAGLIMDVLDPDLEDDAE